MIRQKLVQWIRQYSRLTWALIFCYAARLLITFLPSHGYLHPDEFFQFTEPIGKFVGKWHGQLTWEWTSEHPLRSVFFPYLLVAPLFVSLRWLFQDKVVCGYLLLVLPRLVFALLSFSADYAVYRLHVLSRMPRVKEALLLHASSYIVFTYLTRTLTNCIEYWLFAWLLVTLVDCSRQRVRSTYAIRIALILALGIWSRATFAAFAAYPVYHWLTLERRPQRKFIGNLKLAALKALRLIGWLVPFSLFLIVLDTCFYRPDFVLKIVEGNFAKIQFSELVITPLNFAVYNASAANLVKHGINWCLQHLFINLPLVALILVPLFKYESAYLFLHLCRNRDSKYAHLFKSTVRTLLLISCWPPLLLLSLIPHQEPRFLLPLLFPLVILYAPRVYQNRALLSGWLILNLILFWFFAFVHQSGVTSSILHLKHVLRESHPNQSTTVIFSSVYLPPQHLFGIPQTSNQIDFLDLSQAQFPSAVQQAITKIRPTSKNFLVIPTILNERLQQLLSKTEVRSTLIKQNFPTFNFEVIRWPRNWSWNELYTLFSTDIWQLEP